MPIYMYDEKKGYEVVGEIGNKKNKKKKVILPPEASLQTTNNSSAGTGEQKKKFESPGHYTAKDREKIPLKDFGDPDNRKFPIVTQQDVDDAAKLIGKAKDPEAVKARIIKIAKRKGFKIPDAWAKENKSSAGECNTGKGKIKGKKVK